MTTVHTIAIQAFTNPSANPFGTRDFKRAAPSSTSSRPTAFNTHLRLRDGSRCTVCGLNVPSCIDNCHIVGRADSTTWRQLKKSRWIPTAVKSQRHEPRNGIRLCASHHRAFDNYRFFIRYVPEREQFVVINFLDYRHLRRFHGRPLRLDPNHERAPFAGLFYWHERVVRARSVLAANESIPAEPLLPLDDAGDEEDEEVDAGESEDGEVDAGEENEDGGGSSGDDGSASRRSQAPPDPPDGGEDEEEKTPKKKRPPPPRKRSSTAIRVGTTKPGHADMIQLKPIEDVPAFLKKHGLWWSNGVWAGTTEENRMRWLRGRGLVGSS